MLMGNNQCEAATNGIGYPIVASSGLRGKPKAPLTTGGAKGVNMRTDFNIEVKTKLMVNIHCAAATHTTATHGSL